MTESSSAKFCENIEDISTQCHSVAATIVLISYDDFLISSLLTTDSLLYCYCIV